MTIQKEESDTPPIYIAKPNKKYFFKKPKLGIGFVPKGLCTNRCIFCERNYKAMQDLVSDIPIITPRKYSVEEYIEKLKKVLLINKDIDEIVISGIIGEPLLFLEDLIRLVRDLKRETSLPIRLNTNGQASLATKKTSKEVVRLLVGANLDSVIVSLNAINKKDYNYLCRPRMKDAFESVIDSIKNCKNQINVKLSFVDYSKLEPDWPSINKKEIYQFVKQKLGLSQEDVIFRPFIT